MEQLLLTTLSQYAKTDPAAINAILDRVKRLELPKGTVLLREGSIARHLYFIERGFARGFYFDSAGRERTSWFWSETDVMVSYRSFVEQEPARESIELLEDAVVHKLNYVSMESLYDQFPVLNIIGRKMAEQAFFKSGELTLMLRSGSSRENYEKLTAQYPQLLDRAYLKHIASYLGVSQETLSRVRAAKGKK